MKKSAKILSIILAVIMVLSAVPVASFAATTTGEITNTITYEYDSETEVLTISGSGAIPDYDPVDGHIVWAPYHSCNASKVIVEDGITRIGNGAFFSEKSLTSISIPDSVTSIGDGVFESCPKLESLTIPKGVASIGDWLFADCDSLTSITVAEDNPVFDSRNDCNAIIETATNTLAYGCVNTVMPDDITAIGNGAFYCCNNLETIVIPDGVTSIGDDAFDYCDCEWIKIPDSVTSIGNFAFENCGMLTLSISDNVTTLGENAFAYCSNLQTIYCSCSSDKDTVMHMIEEYDMYQRFNYIKLNHEFVADYIDNNDGTHSQKCSECGQYLNPTEHTFVDGVCVCGAKEPAEPNIKDVICDPSPDGMKVLHATVNGQPVKLQFIDENGSTVTFTRDNAKVTIQAYDADGNEVEALDKSAAYEVWTISNQYLAEGKYTAICKNADNVWDAVEDGCEFDVVYSRTDTKVISITPAVIAAKRCEKFDVEVVTGSDVLKVTIQYNGVNYKTFTPSGKNIFGNNVFDCFVASDVKGENTITVQYKTADGWIDCTDVISTVDIGDVTTPRTEIVW